MSRWLALAREAQNKTETLTGRPAETGNKPVQEAMPPLSASSSRFAGRGIKEDIPLTKPEKTSPYGQTHGGRQHTWTGKIVSLDAWRALSEWERHGSKGKMWDGSTQQWGNTE